MEPEEIQIGLLTKMVDRTTNHGLNKYSPGDTEWTHSPDMQHIEERLVVRDVASNLDNYAPHPTATFIATNTGEVYDGDGNTWNRATRKFDSVESTSADVGSTKRISADPGDDVSSLVREAVQNDFNTINIAGNRDRGAYNWDQDLVFKSGDYDSGLTISIDSGVRIEYTGNGTPITWDSSERINYQLEGSVFRLRGGDWRIGDDADPNSAIKIIDSCKSRISPTVLRGWSNSTQNCKAIEMVASADGGFCEDNVVDTFIMGADIGLGSREKDTGLQSFQDNRVLVEVSQANTCCLDLTGDWSDSVFDGCKFILPDGINGAVRLDGVYRGTIFSGFEMEGPGPAFYVDNRTRGDITYPPLIIGGNMEYGGQLLSDNGTGTRVSFTRLVNGKSGLTLEYREPGCKKQCAIRNSGVLIGENGDPTVKVDAENGDIILQGSVKENQDSIDGTFPGPGDNF